MNNFRTIDRQTGFLLPPSVDEWLPEKHLARFVVEVIDGMDLRAMSGSYRGSGSASYHPRILLAILVYGYATGMFSSRKLERATYDSVALRFIAANDHPGHDTIEARVKEGFAREQAEHEAKLAAREAKTAATGKKPSGKPPRPPTQGPLLADQINLTDEESRIMPVAGGGFEQCCNAQAAVAEGSLLVVAIDVVQASNDKQQLQR